MHPQWWAGYWRVRGHRDGPIQAIESKSHIDPEGYSLASWSCRRQGNLHKCLCWLFGKTEGTMLGLLHLTDREGS